MDWLLRELWLVPELSRPPAPLRPTAPLRAQGLSPPRREPWALPLWPEARLWRARRLSRRTRPLRLRPAAAAGLQSGSSTAPVFAYRPNSFAGERCARWLPSTHCLWLPSHRPPRCPPPLRRVWRRLLGKGAARP